ncbi:hypothetical protein VTO42DRAFT_789 [Malbranchea cinnamomea]
MKEKRNISQTDVLKVRHLERSLAGERPPQISLSDVETRLDMHQYNGLFEAPALDKQNGATQEHTIDSITRPQPSFSNGGESAGSEWSSAVGHAMTGKSGRVIHNLQEDIARLTRELALQRSRAEEALKSNEVLKQQLQNVADRLRNAEQLNEANLNSITRRDRKIEDLKAELQSEKKRRIKAEEDARRTNQLAAQERDEHHRSLAEAQEIAHHARSQYDTLLLTRSREQGEYRSRFDAFRRELDALTQREVERQNQLSRFDVIIEQKNREIEAGKERMDRYERLLKEYKEHSDRALSELLQRSRRNDEEIGKALTEAKETTDKMNWVLNVKGNIRDTE